MVGNVFQYPAGHRLKISVPKEGVTIAMAPSGVRAPQRAMPAMHGRPAVPGEPYGEEAYLWTREHFNQRDVSVTIDIISALLIYVPVAHCCTAGWNCSVNTSLFCPTIFLFLSLSWFGVHLEQSAVHP